MQQNKFFVLPVNSEAFLQYLTYVLRYYWVQIIAVSPVGNFVLYLVFDFTMIPRCRQLTCVKIYRNHFLPLK